MKPTAAEAAYLSVHADRDTPEQLVRRIADGDEHALGILYDRYADAVHGVALRVLRDATQARDVVEEVFWQAWRQASRWAPERGGVSTWLLTIARSRAIDRRRALVRRGEESSAPLEQLAAEGADASRGVEESDLRRVLQEALDTLPPEQRDALELAYWGGLTQVEIAERTGQPLGTVKTRMRLALRKLRDRLTELGGDA